MVVYVLHHYFDTPDVEGNEIIGVYSRIEDAQAKMKRFSRHNLLLGNCFKGSPVVDLPFMLA